MPKRSAGATIAQILLAFGEEPTWAQAALAERCGIEVRALKVRLKELAAAGVPLERQDDPPHVYWSVPSSWRPGAVYLSTDDMVLVSRLLGRLPSSRLRGQALAAVASALRSEPVMPEAPDAFSLDPSEDAHLVVVEDALEKKHALRMEYFSAAKGTKAWRTASVHHIVAGPPARFLATCHNTGELKWFRVDRILRAHESVEEAFRGASPTAVEHVLATTVDGYHGDGNATEVSLCVREPESRWVARNHPKPLRVEEFEGGIRLRGAVGSVKQLARWVVSLGSAAKAETPELIEAVRSLATGALTVNGGA
jgi:predicted DNA-binding transcriptional regulator YafY